MGVRPVSELSIVIADELTDPGKPGAHHLSPQDFFGEQTNYNEHTPVNGRLSTRSREQLVIGSSIGSEANLVKSPT